MILYNEKLKPILNDLEDPKIELAGGSTVGMILSIINSLICYICNLTIGKANYEKAQDEVIKIKEQTINLKEKMLYTIDQDKIVLEKILRAYKVKKSNPEMLESASKESVIFCKNVMDNAVETLELTKKIANVGNKMLASDFEIAKLYAFSSIEACVVNIEVNLKSVQDAEFVRKIRNEYKTNVANARNLMKNF